MKWSWLLLLVSVSLQNILFDHDYSALHDGCFSVLSLPRYPIVGVLLLVVIRSITDCNDGIMEMELEASEGAIGIFCRKEDWSDTQSVDPRAFFVTLRCISFTKFEMVLLSKLSEGGVIVEVFSFFTKRILCAVVCIVLTQERHASRRLRGMRPLLNLQGVVRGNYSLRNWLSNRN